MVNDVNGSRLIFLVSQPRAGSTLFQRILRGHPDIHTVAEPWLMLHPILPLRDSEYQVDFDERLAKMALNDFLGSFPDGEEAYYESVRIASWFLYSKCLETSGARYFLDKTPRYYFILPELRRVFPEARFIILIRNPIAVLISIVRTWVCDNIRLMPKFKHDLFEAPRLLADAIQRHDNKATVVHYEHLVRRPIRTVALVCEELGLDFLPDMIDYGRQEDPNWRFGDQGTIKKSYRPVAENDDAWQKELAAPQIWRFARDYLRQLGPQTIADLGYDADEISNIIADYTPRRSRLKFTSGLDDVINGTPSRWFSTRLKWRAFRRAS